MNVHRGSFGGDKMIRRGCEVRGAEESDGGEAGIVLRRGDEAERGQDEVGADEGEQGESAQARGGRAAMIFPRSVRRVFDSGTRRNCSERTSTYKAPRPTIPPAAAIVKAGTT